MCNCILCLTSGGAQCCAIWSAMSVLFLVCAGVILGSPPVYVKGMNPEQAKTASSNSYVVAGMYAATTILAVFMYNYRSRQENSKLGKPVKAPDSGLGDGDAFNVPLVSSSATGASSATAEGASRSSSGGSKKKKANKSTRSENAITTI